MATDNTYDVLDASASEEVDAGQECTNKEENASPVVAAADTGDAKENIIVKEEVDKENCGTYTGQCKWFNDKLGFGFITICEGNDKGRDIFVHHSGIKPLNSNYRTLKKGEYINFNVVDGLNGLQAVDVTGIHGGPLMCDHVTNGKRVVPIAMNAPVSMPAIPQKFMPRDREWQTVAKKPVKAYSAVGGSGTPSVSKYDKNKRYPPNNRPYKRNNSVA